MSVSAATHSQVLATAPAPKRLAYGQRADRSQFVDPTLKAIAKMALEIRRGRPAYGGNGDLEKARLMQAFGIDEKTAANFMQGAAMKVALENSGSSPRPAAYVFPSAEAAKEFARAKFDQLEYGVQNYNLGIKSWSAEKIRGAWENNWNANYNKRFEKNGGDQAEAIAFADANLKKNIERTSAVGGGDYQLRLGLGGLEAFGPLPANLLTQNADGTLTINRNALKDTVLGSYLNIGSNIGQRIDRAA